ncbi:MAG: protein-export chaperone SecB [Oscillospiraceae bacterium]|nr:protein-export chaperone SecB [Oscillospiraceae bacterium]
MAIAHLVTQKVEEVHFVNKLQQQGQIQLETSFTFNVNFAKDGKRCIARIYQSVKDNKGGEQLFASLDLVGAFACEGVETEEDKKIVHAQCYDQLFPYVQSTIQNLMQASGIPGFQLRKAIINTDHVQVGQPPEQQPQQEPEKPQFPIV